MKTRATTPSACARPASAKAMPPGPSDPASMPMSRKKMSAGTPSRPDVLLATTLTSSSTPPTSRTVSIGGIVCAMEWLNYHHLLYFWTVVRTGSVVAASAELRLAPPTISVQIRRLEDQLGEKLLRRSGRRVVPTEVGQAVFRYADEIFALGREVLDLVR